MSDSEVSVKPENFTVELVIENQVTPISVSELNKESVLSLLAIQTSLNFPRLQGWNLYDESGKCMASIDAIGFVAKLAEGTPIGKTSGDPATDGWRVLPAITPTSEGFSKEEISRAKEDATLRQALKKRR